MPEAPENARIVLASGSPRRKMLLEQIGLKDFEIRVPRVREWAPAGLGPREIVEMISMEKAQAAEASPDEIVIAADTMVFLDEEKLGKPKSPEAALDMLSELQGRWHTVRTGITVRQGERFLTESEETDVLFRAMTRDELKRYVDTGEPMDKAGAYGLQGRGVLLVERIEGDYTNVIGLPLPRLARMLSKFGVIL